MAVGIVARPVAGYPRLNLPRTPADFTPRPRLLERLNYILRLPVTVIAAPAGMGKTTLLSIWAETCPLPVAWLSVEASDSQPEPFLRGLIASIQTLYPAFGRSTLTALNGATIPSAHALATGLAAELDELGQELVVILDDYEAVGDPATHQIMRELLPRLPLTTHLVIASRQMPLFPMTRLRAQGAVLDVLADDLRFDHQEAQALLEQAAGRPVEPEFVDGALSQTEGWAVALRLLGLALRDDADAARVMTAPRASSHSQVLAFFLEEVYSQQPPAVQAMLLRTSILDRLTPALCEAMTDDVRGEWTGQAFVDWLASTNLLVVPVDADGVWFRLHGLLQRALQFRLQMTLEPAAIEALHGRAAAWFEARGLVDKAIGHYLAAGVTDRAVHLVERHMLTLITREEWLRLEGWLHLLPPERVACNPVLLIGETWAMTLRQGYSQLQARIEQIQHLLHGPEADQAAWSKAGIEAGLAALAAPAEWMAGNVEAALQRATRARLTVDATYSPLDGWAAFNSGVALHLTGRQDAALDLLNTAVAEGTQRGNTELVIRSLLGLAFVHWLRGDLASVEAVGRQLLPLYSRHARPIGVGWVNFLLGLGYYERNQLDQARYHLEAVLAHRHEVNHMVLRGSVFALARVDDLEGQSSAADALLDSLTDLAWDTTNLVTLRLLAAFRAHRAAWHGKAAEARRWLLEVRPTPEQGAMVLTEVPQLAQARVLVASGQRDDAREALTHLAHLEHLSVAFSNVPMRVAVSALSALAYDRLGNKAAAEAWLEQAVRLGKPGGFTRNFLDLGPDIARLLDRWTPREELADYVGYLLRQFAVSPSLHVATDRAMLRQRQAQARLRDPLSPRELEILDLLVRRHSYREIAHRLVISPSTVKKHIHHIYEKLDVNSRAEAIEVSQRLGLVTLD